MHSKLITITLLCLTITLLGAHSENYAFSGGSGNQEDPFKISNVEDLQHIHQFLNSHFILSNDINLNDVEWDPVGSFSKPFSGSFNGNGFAISNLNIISDSKVVGFFGVIKNAEISNLNLNDVFVHSSRQFVGGLAGGSINSSINSVSVSGKVSSDSYAVGGLVADSYLTSFTSSSFAGVVSAHRSTVGGLAGFLTSGSIKDSFSSADVIANSSFVAPAGQVGGLAGGGWGSSISSSIFYGNISIDSDAYYSSNPTSSWSSKIILETGGLFGVSSTDSFCIDSFYDTTTSSSELFNECGIGLSTEDLQTPIKASGIYSSWSEDIWNFGTSTEYPTLKKAIANEISEECNCVVIDSVKFCSSPECF